MRIEVRNMEELDQAALQIKRYAEDLKVWLFEGDLGAGKTTLIKRICDHFNITDTVNSPSFSIVNEYRDDKGEKYYHLDFYRIKNEEEAMDIGAEEYIFSGNYCFIEWPSKVSSLLPDHYLSVSISQMPDGTRSLNLVKYD